MKKLLLTLLVLISANAHGTDANRLIQFALEKDLPSHGQWRKLLHYRGSSSVVTTQSFFVSPSGVNDPKDELVATIQGFYKPANSFEIDQHPQCLFPARLMWLENELDFKGGIPRVSCPRLDNWKKINKVESISLQFVSGYLGNPASFFGHSLLKMNASNAKTSSDSPLLDMSVNYGASIGEGDGPLEYIAYGVFGGYQAEYTIENFYVHDFTYAEIESRVIWEYELNLNRFDVLMFEAHIWELKSKKFDYYFINRNCATQIAFIIETITGVDLTSQYQPWDAPIDLFKNIEGKYYKGKPFVAKVIKRESKLSRLKQKYAQLTTKEKSAARAITASINAFQEDLYQLLSERSKSKIISLLYDYYDVFLSEENPDASFKTKLLVENFKLNPIDINWVSYDAVPPHESQNPIKLGFSYGENNHSGSFYQIDFRIGYYDYLFLDVARFRESNAVFLETEIKNTIKNEKLYLNRFTFFDISSLNLTDFDLVDSKKYAWGAKFSIENNNLSCERCLTPKLSGKYGVASDFYDEFTLFILPMASLDVGDYSDSFAGVNVGFLYLNNEYIKYRFSITPVLIKHDKNKSDYIYESELRFGSSKSWDIRAKLKHNVTSEFSLSYAMYF